MVGDHVLAVPETARYAVGSHLQRGMHVRKAPGARLAQRHGKPIVKDGDILRVGEIEIRIAHPHGHCIDAWQSPLLLQRAFAFQADAVCVREREDVAGLDSRKVQRFEVRLHAMHHRRGRFDGS